MPDNNDSFATFEGSVDLIDQEVETLDVQRIEENCDRINESILGGFLYEHEEIDCPDNDYSDEDGGE